MAGVVAAALALMFALDDDREDAAPIARLQTTADSPPPAETAETGPVMPAFDVVRVNQAGQAVLAGRAAPEAEVVLFDDALELGRVNVDGRGEWVFVPSVKLSPGQHELSLLAFDAGGKTRASADVVLLVVPESAKQGSVFVARTDRGGGNTRVLQGLDAPSDGKALTIEAVDHLAGGGLSLSGRSSPKALVQLYVDTLFAGRVQAGTDGRWRIGPTPAVSPGPHTLRVDRIGAEGQVVGRAEIPFLRAEPALVPPQNRFLMVPSGDNLWRIARKTDKNGTAYTDIYRNPQSMIRDPDHIYPGQVFTLPPPQ